MLIRSEATAQAVLQAAQGLSNKFARFAKAAAEHGIRPFPRGIEGTVEEFRNADKGFRAPASDNGDPSFPRPMSESGLAQPDRFYNGARLWQVDQVFPRAFRGEHTAAEEGYIRTASHSTAGDVVYLTDGDDIAGVYGTITSWTDVRDGTMRFHPVGMVLGLDANRIRVNPMAAEGHSAANFVEGVSDRVYTTPGRVDTSEIVSVEFQIYENIIDNPDVILVADGFPAFEGLGLQSLRDPAVVADRLSWIADAVRRNYPTINVTVGANHLTSDEAIRVFLAT